MDPDGKREDKSPWSLNLFATDKVSTQNELLSAKLKNHRVDSQIVTLFKYTAEDGSEQDRWTISLTFVEDFSPRKRVVISHSNTNDIEDFTRERDSYLASGYVAECNIFGFSVLPNGCTHQILVYNPKKSLPGLSDQEEHETKPEEESSS